jgi:hypothetical protein
VNGQGTTLVHVSPTDVHLQSNSIGETIQVNITVENVHDLFGFDIMNVTFNPAVLELIDVQEGSFMQSEGQTMFIWSHSAPGLPDSSLSKGILNEVLCAYMTSATISGSGVLATLNFKVLSVGNSPIMLNYTALVGGGVAGAHTEIDHSSINGNVTITYDVSSTPTPTGSENAVPSPSSSISITPSVSPNPSTTVSGDASITPNPTVPEFSNLTVPILLVMGFVVSVILSRHRFRTK